jgi:hypothetical protein
MGLTAARTYFRMTPAQFRSFIGAHYVTLRSELASRGISYDALGPALVPSTNRHEMALLFNVDLVGSFWGYAIAKQLMPLLERKSTLSVLAGDIGLYPMATREMASSSGLVSSDVSDWGQQFIFCLYLNNLSDAQQETLHASFCANPGYLGYVPATYRSHFRTIAGEMVPTVFVKHKGKVLVDHGGDEPLVSDMNEIGYPFQENGYEVVSVNSQLFSPLLSYKIQSEVFPQHKEDVLVSLNAISDEPMKLDQFEVLLPEAKYGYLQSKKGDILKIAGLDRHSREELASVIRAELDNDYIYRLQSNVDGTVQFSIVLELPRKGTHPIRVAVGLKYFPESKTLSLVTLT